MSLSAVANAVVEPSRNNAALATVGSELLKNGSFEAASPAPTQFSPDSSIRRVAGGAYSGQYYERIASTSGAYRAAGFVNRPAVTGKSVGTNLAASCYVRSNGTYPAILRISEVGGGTKKVKERLSTTSKSWTRIDLSYTVAMSGSQLFLAIYSTGPTTVNGGGVAVDGCTLKQVSGALPALAAAPGLPTSAPSGYTRRFTESFNTAAPLGSFDSVYGARFSEYSGCCTTNGQTVYSSRKVLYASNGSLYYYMHSENGTSYTAAPVPGKYLNFKYGQVGATVRLASSVGNGYKLAFLLWPQNDTWTNEVDFAEVYPDFSQPIYATSLVTTTAKGVHAFRGGPTRTSGITLADNRYHTVLMDWQPGLITVKVDGKTAATFTGSAVPTQPMHVVMQTEGWTNHGGVPAASNATLEVPWIYINTRN